MDRRTFLSFIVPVIAAALVSAQAQFSDAVRAYIKVDAPVVALTNVRVIDGTGAPARSNQTIVISNGTIDRIGDSVGARWDNGVVTMPDGYAAAYGEFVEGGWMSLAGLLGAGEAAARPTAATMVTYAVQMLAGALVVTLGAYFFAERAAASALSARGDACIRSRSLPLIWSAISTSSRSSSAGTAAGHGSSHTRPPVSIS